MLHVHPAFVCFREGEDGGEAQHITFENPSSRDEVTFKIEANCSTRYKVVPITGLLAPGAQESVSFSLRTGEAPKPAEDRFLIRSSVFDREFGATPRDFWANKKKLAEFTCEKQIVQVVPASQFFPNLHEEEEEGEGENAGKLPQSEYVQSIRAMAKRAEAEGNFPLAAAWYEFMLPHLASVQHDVDRNVAKSDEFDLLVARDEVYKLQNQRQDLETSFSHHHHGTQTAVAMGGSSAFRFNSPTPLVGKTLPRRTSSGTSSGGTGVPHFAAPTEASLAMRRAPATPLKPSPSSPQPTPTKRLFPGTPLTAASAPSSSSAASSSTAAYKPFKPANLKYILDVFPMFSTAGATRIILPAPDLTVREMKDLILQSLKLNKEYEDLDLYVKDMILSDHWRGSDFGIRPGITRLQMKRKRRSPVKRAQHSTKSATPKQQPPPTAPSQGEEEESSAVWEAKCSELAQELMEMTLERDLLLKQLDQMGKEYDVLAGKVLVLGRDKDQLELDKMELTQRLFVRDNVTTAGRQQQQSIGCFCVIASPALFVDHELDESLIANPVQIASTEYLFDWVDFRATPESIVNELPQTWLDSVLLCTTDRTLVLVGETLGGKTLLLEGFTSPRRNGVYHLLCHRLLDMLGNSGANEEVFLAMSGFQTFQSGRVIDFLDYNHGEKELMSSLEEFEQVLANLLREKLVDEAAADVLREGRPTSADSCVVINFELVRRDGTTASVLRVVETCGVEHCQDENEVLVGHIIRGDAPLVCCVLHPALNEHTSALACSSARDIASRF